ASASLTMTVDGIEDIAVLEGALFPVPVSDQLNVRLAAPLTADARVEVRDLQGRLVTSAQMRQNEQLLVLDAAAWTAGVYTLQLSTEEARASWSFVK
ncbi:MAG: T9SS type A sorting domain-containing protein, partial [Flavobacteriales bacterium]|nr:T9SS type A sorting domain-containing protein [Flavobacteriales bacterium]